MSSTLEVNANIGVQVGVTVYGSHNIVVTKAGETNDTFTLSDVLSTNSSQTGNYTETFSNPSIVESGRYSTSLFNSTIQHTTGFQISFSNDNNINIKASLRLKITYFIPIWFNGDVIAPQK